ncbi:MAG: GH92 family glycosyl hydrolase [Bacteroidales bacterium]|nr:GH92 family glycosyl hydrolase [Bacteroidales bacterium]
MNKLLFPIILLAMMTATAQRDYTQYVNPMIGTNGMGHTFPGACYPFGGVQVSPDTDTIPHNINGKYQPGVYDYCAGYQYRDKTIVGFSHTHFSGTGHSDMGDILLMPFTGEVQLNPGTADNPDAGYRSRFSHETEKASPGYYEVRLSDDDILVQLTATPHCGIHKYTFPQGEPQKLIVDLNHCLYNYDGKVLWASLRMEDPWTLTGYRITNGWARENYVFFSIHFSKPVAHYGYQDFGKQDYHGFWGRFDVNHDFPEMAGRKVVAWIEFVEDIKGIDSVLEIQVSLSAVSTDGAIKNRKADFQNKSWCSFEELHQMTKNAWNNKLGMFEAKGTDDQLAMFYTSLYHTMINPSIYQDVDGNYRGVDHNIHQNKEGHTNYTIFSLWDTYRAEHPLLNIIDPKSASDMVESMLNHARQSVHHILPIWSHAGNENWCMIGYHGVSVVADAWLNNAGGFQQNNCVFFDSFDDDLFTLVLNSAYLDYYDHTDTYIKSGYVPYNQSAVGTSITLENAYEDWVIYHLFDEKIKKDYEFLRTQGDLEDRAKRISETFRQRALNFKNVFNPETGFAQARYEDGSWKTPADLLSTANEGFIEGNSWNYSFYVPHDVNGLIKIMGGDKVFVNRLDELFTMYVPDKFFAETEDVTREGMLGGYVHGNEPSHHIPYLYMWTSQPWKTQLRVREVMNKMYRNHLDGLCGNDDCGQMSAWYIFSAMGFYPVCPASGQYVFGAPYLPENVLHLQNGNTLTIKAPNVSDQNCYIQSVTLNGTPLHTSYITYEQIMAGGELIFTMGSKPNKKWFTEKPYSLE